MGTFMIGVVGYSSQQFNETEANYLLGIAFDAILADSPGATDIWVVSGLTDMGIPALAYRAAVARGWRTVGIACTKAAEFECFGVDERIVDDKWLNWGDESETFLREINALVRIGGGKQSHAEVAIFKERGGNVYEYELAAIPG